MRAAVLDDARSTNPVDRLLEDSWETRDRKVTRRELAVEGLAGTLLLAVAVPLAVASDGVALGTAALLVALYAVMSRIEFPVGAGFVVPSYLVLVPMLVLLPPGVVPLLTASGLVLGALGQLLAGRGRPERVLFSVPDAWHAVGPALVLLLAGGTDPGLSTAVVYFAAFLAACLVDLLSATLRESAALGIAPQLQLRVVAVAWLADACLAPVGYMVAIAASSQSANALLVLPLGAMLVMLARDRSARIAQAQSRLELVLQERTRHQELREQAVTDSLTRLGNRRALIADLSERLRAPSVREPFVLMLFDLDGFKDYNDTFGHLAGDALLTRLGAKLSSAVADQGTAYRLGGDEFCALIDARTETLHDVVAAAAEALEERGSDFVVEVSYGAVVLPHEATSPDYALQLADERMYAHKQIRSSGVREETRDVLMRIMHARQPHLHDHSSEVAELALLVGRRLGMNAEELDELARAAELHDVGKVGIPDAILDKPGPLNQDEWAFIRQHTVLGERILNAARALRPVAAIVRASHERWDGRGYPDALGGDQIPLGARIVAVCDAYEAMTTDRCYRRAMPESAACDELRREAGRQFDAAVVEAFLAELERRRDQFRTGRSDADLEDASGAAGVSTYLREVLERGPENALR